MNKRFQKYVVFALLAALVWLFANQAMNMHSHILLGGQVITHAHPYKPDKNSNSPYQSHKHQPSVAFFLDLISSLNVDSFGSIQAFLFLLTILAILTVTTTISPYLEYKSSGTSRAPPML